LAAPSIGGEPERLVLEVLRSGRLAQGPVVERLESLCADMAGTSHAVAMANGSLALEAVLALSGLGPGDEVITTPFTFIATLNAILSTGASVRFADIGDDFNLDPDSVEAELTSHVAMILPVHLYGCPSDMDRLSEIARRFDLAIVEDAAQAHGARVGDRRVGSFGAGTFSFYATKNVTCGEGGVVTTSDDHLAAELRLLRNQGMAARYEYVRIGRNLRLSEIQAAVAIPQLERLGDITAARTANAEAMSSHLSAAGIEGLELPLSPEGRTHVWHQYTVLLPTGADRDVVIKRMNDAGVEVGTYYPKLVWEHPPYENHPEVVVTETPRAQDATRRCLSVPIHQGLARTEVTEVATALVDALS
jgi:dTDP-4-amino-4,6-dideoxygalactose transaminase